MELINIIYNRTILTSKLSAPYSESHIKLPDPVASQSDYLMNTPSAPSSIQELSNTSNSSSLPSNNLMKGRSAISEKVELDTIYNLKDLKLNGTSLNDIHEQGMLLSNENDLALDLIEISDELRGNSMWLLNNIIQRVNLNPVKPQRVLISDAGKQSSTLFRANLIEDQEYLNSHIYSNNQVDRDKSLSRYSTFDDFIECTVENAYQLFF